MNFISAEVLNSISRSFDLEKIKQFIQLSSKNGQTFSDYSFYKCEKLLLFYAFYIIVNWICFDNK